MTPHAYLCMTPENYVVRVNELKNQEAARYSNRWEAEAFALGFNGQPLPPYWDNAGDELRIHKTLSAWNAGNVAGREAVK